MAKASWCTTNPSSGSGNGTVGVSGFEHTGRSSRSTTVTFSAAGVSDKPVSVVQGGLDEFVQIQATAAVGKDGGTVTLSGTSNSQKLTFSLGAGSLDLSLPENYTANSASTANNAAIVGDPGATAQYSFSIMFDVQANEGITEISKQIIVTANGGQTATSTLTQAEGEATLSVAPTTIELTAAGTAVNVIVTSNTNWTVS